MTGGADERCHRLAEMLETAVPDDPPAFAEVPCLVTVGVGVATVGVLAALFSVGFLAGPARSAGLGLGAALAMLAGYGTWTAPSTVRAVRRRTAVGAAPEVVSYAVLQARLTPSLERAAAFAGAQSTGLLVRHLRRIGADGSSGRAGWDRFAAAWADFDETLPRAVSLLAAGIESAQPARDELFDRALETVLDGSRDRVATFAADVRAPATGIYAFGVLLPLAMVGLLPVAASAGAGVSPATIAVLYDGIIPAGLLAASGWLAARRPAVSRPPAGATSLAGPRRPTVTAAVGLGTAAAATVVGLVTLPRWTLWSLVPGVGVGAAAVYWFDPIRERRSRVEAIESGIPDAVALVGHRLAAGDPLEVAVAGIGDRLSGETAAVFRDGVAVHRSLRLTVTEAFTGPDGALAGIDTPRTETAIQLIAAAAHNGPDGGESLVTIATYFRELHRVERAARRDLARTTETLRQTALVFGPAIAGVTVALATGMGSLGDAGTAVAVDALGVSIGGYVLALAVVLPSLAVVLERGLDLGLVGFRVGVALLTASVVYPVTFVAARTVVQV